ncbi:hypothetical protein [Pontimicrobium sp. SW4]|uniref:Uncharacterized protein n=1 Tax=Pontimicrobium sp. SW4 TaxID=3153519 RepID=A0AAU7BUK6_9FLAO
MAQNKNIKPFLKATVQLNILAAFGVAHLSLDDYLKSKINGKEV